MDKKKKPQSRRRRSSSATSSQRRTSRRSRTAPPKNKDVYVERKTRTAKSAKGTPPWKTSASRRSQASSAAFREVSEKMQRRRRPSQARRKRETESQTVSEEESSEGPRRVRSTGRGTPVAEASMVPRSAKREKQRRRRTPISDAGGLVETMEGQSCCCQACHECTCGLPPRSPTSGVATKAVRSDRAVKMPPGLAGPIEPEEDTLLQVNEEWSLRQQQRARPVGYTRAKKSTCKRVACKMLEYSVVVGIVVAVSLFIARKQGKAG